MSHFYVCDFQIIRPLKTFEEWA